MASTKRIQLFLLRDLPVVRYGVYAQGLRAQLPHLATRAGLVTVMCRSGIVRFVQGGVIKTSAVRPLDDMEVFLELLAQLVFEVFVQGVFELGGHGLVSIFRKEGSADNPWLVICGYCTMGAIAGGISVCLMPMHLLKLPALQILNLAITPVVLGFIFEFTGRWKTRRDKPRYAVDRFLYGFTFALTMGLIRYFFTA